MTFLEEMPFSDSLLVTGRDVDNNWLGECLIPVTIHATPDFAIYPASIVAPNNGESQSASLVTTSGSEIELVTIDSCPAWISATLTPSANETQRYTLSVKSRGLGPAERQATLSLLIFRRADPNPTQLLVPVWTVPGVLAQ